MPFFSLCLIEADSHFTISAACAADCITAGDPSVLAFGRGDPGRMLPGLAVLKMRAGESGAV